MFEFQNVWFKKQGQWILKNINWQVKAGERWGILGLNGSGKTTLMQLINGYMWATKGQITVLEEVFGKLLCLIYDDPLVGLARLCNNDCMSMKQLKKLLQVGNLLP